MKIAHAAVAFGLLAFASGSALAQQIQTTPGTKSLTVTPPQAGSPLDATQNAFTAPARQGWSPPASLPRGQVVCGGVMANGQLQPPCDVKPAVPVSKPLLSCPQGTFSRPEWNAVKCYACPPGYQEVRSPEFHKLENLCFRETAAGETFAKASFVGKLPLNERSLCTGESFFVDANGGECWVCPEDMRRTVQDPQGPNACRRGLTGAFAPAKFVNPAPKKCAGDQFWSAREGGECWTCPPEYRRSSRALTGDQACVQRNRVHAEASYRGTLDCRADGQWPNAADVKRATACMTCPQGYERNRWRGALGLDQCTAALIQWQSPTFPDPGFFALAGAEQAAAAWLADPRQFSEYLAIQAKAGRVANVRGFIDTNWRQTASAPHASSAFLAFAYVKLLDIMENGPQNENEAKLLANFGQYVTARRTFMAQEALNAYLEWKKAADHHRDHRASTTKLSDLIYLEPEPPSTDAIVYNTAASAVEMAGFVFGALQPLAAVSTTTVRVTWRAGQAIARAAKMGTLAGPLVVLAIAAEIGIRATIQTVKAMKAQPQLEAALHKARQPVDFSRLVRTGEGVQQVALYWAQVTSNANTRPSPQFVSYVQASYAKAAAASFFQ